MSDEESVSVGVSDEPYIPGEDGAEPVPAHEQFLEGAYDGETPQPAEDHPTDG